MLKSVACWFLASVVMLSECVGAATSRPTYTVFSQAVSESSVIAVVEVLEARVVIENRLFQYRVRATSRLKGNKEIRSVCSTLPVQIGAQLFVFDWRAPNANIVETRTLSNCPNPRRGAESVALTIDQLGVFESQSTNLEAYPDLADKSWVAFHSGRLTFPDQFAMQVIRESVVQDIAEESSGRFLSARTIVLWTDIQAVIEARRRQ